MRYQSKIAIWREPSMTQLNLDSIQNYVEDHQDDLQDQTVSTGGGDFVRELLPAKNHPVRLVGYVEMGIHEKKKFQSEEVDDVDTVRLVFHLAGSSPKAGQEGCFAECAAPHGVFSAMDRET